MQRAIKTWAAAVALGASGALLAQQGETVKIAWMDPLSGMMAAVGSNQLKNLQYIADELNKQGTASGVKFEIMAFDNKLSPQETTAALRSAMDQGARYIIQGNGSGPALAIIDALEKHNARNKGKEAIYLNHSAVDPDLTNSKCSYWHFAIDANTSMKMEALTTYMQERSEIKKVYLINQNYSHGHQVSKYAKEMLQRKRPDIEIVGDDFSPLAQVRDFAPYVAKIKQSGADSVVTGNWGTDLALLIKAVNDAGLSDIRFYTYYAIAIGSPTAMGAASEGKVYMVGYGHKNLPGPLQPIADNFEQKFDDELITSSLYTALVMLDTAFARAKTTDPAKIAATLEGLKFTSHNGDVEMRKSDHQLQQPLFITRWEKASAEYPRDSEKTGYTFVPVQRFEPYVASTPTSCQMKRPQ